MVCDTSSILTKVVPDLQSLQFVELHGNTDPILKNPFSFCIHSSPIIPVCPKLYVACGAIIWKQTAENSCPFK